MRTVWSAWWSLALVVAYGCGEAPKAESPATTPSVAAPVTTAPVTAAPKPLPAQLLGAWQVDLDYIKTDAEMLALPPEKRAKAMAMAAQLLKDLRIVFDKTTVSVGAGENVSKGTYRAWATAPDTLAVEARLKTASGAEEDETLSVQFVDGRALITGKDGKATRFKRAAATP